MSVIRSLSASELTIMVKATSSKDNTVNDEFDHEVRKENGEDKNFELISEEETLDSLSSQTQTLDRFSRPSSMNQHGEKRKKSFFASFRLSKKSLGKGKEDQGSSTSNYFQMTGRENDYNNSALESNTNAENKYKDRDETNCYTISSKPRKHYLNRMSSFVNRVANRVQNGEVSQGYGLKGKLERSQTVTGTDLVSVKVDYVLFENQTPGLIGIRNHGNTCFINAVIQCLSHTDVLAEYFVMDQYKNDLARCNRINSKKFGTRGEITEHLAILLKSLWVLRYVPDISLNLKNIIEKYEPCYRGSNQHDAAEFLMFILDKVHEDLNTASKRKYKKIKNTYGRPDEVVAAETLANHLRCNSSFVQDIFQAQFRSSLKCPHCLKESNTFDPYLCVSIPIPQKEVLAIFVTVVYLNQQPKQVKVGVSIEASSSIKQLRSVIAADCGICPSQLVLTEIDGEGFHRTFADNACVNIIKSTDPIYGIELTPFNAVIQENEAFLHIMWVNVLLTEPENIRFGGVYQSEVARDVTYPDLQKLLLKEMSTIVTMETLISEQECGIFLIGIDSGSKKLAVLESDLDVPLFHQCVEESLSICHPLAGPPHVKLVLQWTQESKTKYIIDDVDHVDEHSSVEELKKHPPECATVSLNDCLQLHTSAEMLSCSDAWHCPTCNRKQQVLKRLTLWSSPQVLVIHLKRFRQVSLSSNSSKLNTIVDFPLYGFDISDHMAGRHCAMSPSCNPPETGTTKVLGGVLSPWRRPKKFNIIENEHIYDLYAICNHHGRDLQGGHYTAVCRNPTNGKWYNYDDFNIEEVPQENVAAQDAYILFYQRREDPATPCFNNDSKINHWSYRIPVASLPAPLKIIPDPIDDKDSLNEGISSNDVEPLSDELPNDTPISDKTTTPPEIVNHLVENFMNISETPVVINSFKSAPPTSTLKVETVIAEVVSPKTEPSPVCINQNKSVNMETDSSSPVQETKNDVSVDRNSKPIVHRSRYSHEGLLSIMRETVDTRDIGSTRTIVDSSMNNQETIPEVRIQPASLEVLASHRYRLHPAKQNVVKVTLRPKSHDLPCSRPPSIASSSSRSSNSDSSPLDSEAAGEHKSMNGYLPDNECFTSYDEATPEVVINSSNQNKHAINSFSQNVKITHRKPNTNKTPSFVVIRTPTASPRNPRERNSNGLINSKQGCSKLKTKEECSLAIKCESSHNSKEKSLPYKFAGQNARPSQLVSAKRSSLGVKFPDSEVNNYEKNKSKSCTMEYEEKKDNCNHFMTESSV